MDISFFSVKNRSMNTELELVRREIGRRIPDASFRYFVQNEKGAAEIQVKKMREARKIFAKEATDVITCDASVPRKFRKDGTRILLALPCGYFFTELEKAEGGLKAEDRKKTFDGITHVITGSPFGHRVMEEVYDSGHMKLLDHVLLPAAYQMRQDDDIAGIRRAAESHFPEMKGKKVLGILLTGRYRKQDVFSETGLKKLLDDLGENWFVMISDAGIIQEASRLSFRYHSRIGSAGNLFPMAVMGALADVLVTDDCKHAATYASRKKPVFYTRFRDTAFVRYMDRHYDRMGIDCLDDLARLPVWSDCKTDDCSTIESVWNRQEAAFWKEFAWDQTEDVFDVIADLLRG